MTWFKLTYTCTYKGEVQVRTQCADAESIGQAAYEAEASFQDWTNGTSARTIDCGGFKWHGDLIVERCEPRQYPLLNVWGR